MRWTRAALVTNSAGCGRRSRVVLTPRRWRQVLREDAQDDGDKKARSPGRARNKLLKPLRAGMPGDSGGPVVTMLVCFIYFAREAAGALGTRHSPRPLLGEGFMHDSGASRRGNAKLFPAVIAREGARSSIPETLMIKSRGGGVLDRPVKPDDDSSPQPSFPRKRESGIPETPENKREAAAYWIPRGSLFSGSPKARPGGGI
jgi:hypothetical protein